MSTLQHINSSINYHWPELSRRYPGFEKPQIVPAATLRGLAPTYLKSAIDSDPDSYFLFIAGDVTKGDCRRETACQFFDELFYDKLGMPSSYDIQAGGQYERAEAIDHEVLPPADNRQFQSYYDEQMERARAMEQDSGDTGAANNNDDDVIDVELGADGTYQSAADRSRSERAVGQASSTAVGMPRKIFFCVDFHCGSNAMLGYNRGENRLHGRRSSGFLREEGETDAEFAERQAIAQMAECGLTEEEPVEESLFGGSKIPSVSEEYDNVKQVKDVISKIKDRFGKIAVVKMGCDRILSDIVANDDDALEFGKACFGLLVGIADNMDKLNEAEETKKQVLAKLISMTKEHSELWNALKDIEEKFNLGECEKCGDPACKDGEICGLKEEEKKAEKPVEEEIKLEKDLLGRTVIAEEDLDEFEPEADGSEYYGKVMEKVGAIEDDEPVCEENDVDECDIAEMIELGKKIR